MIAHAQFNATAQWAPQIVGRLSMVRIVPNAGSLGNASLSLCSTVSRTVGSVTTTTEVLAKCYDLSPGIPADTKMDLKLDLHTTFVITTTAGTYDVELHYS